MNVMESGKNRPPVPEREEKGARPDDDAGEDFLDEVLKQTFPASDPPAWEPLHPGAPAEHPNGLRSWERG